MPNRKPRRNPPRHGPSSGASGRQDAKPTGARPPASTSRPTGPGGGRVRNRGRANTGRPAQRSFIDRYGVFFLAGTFIISGAIFIYFTFVNPPGNPSGANETPNAILPAVSPVATLAAIPTVAKARFDKAPDMTIDANKRYAVTIETVKGTIKADLLPKDSPVATNNFVFLARNGFYDGLTFHRVEDWVIQGGDPSGNGTGGPGYTIKDEPTTRDYKPGVLAMAKTSAPDSGGSQFFFIKKETPLPKTYAIFGLTTEGQNVIDQIQIGDKILKVTIAEQ